ncbi:MAG: sigma-54 dependent transcriptional regulator [Myxococcota bacterium]|nr:sigma-54 dependent transcriptional regulator [Myxococcota bacterium]
MPILVGDDGGGVRHLLGVILQREGHTVIEAADGEAALAVLAARPDVRIMFSDIRMPRMDGMALLQAVQSQDLRVVMMSAYGTQDTAVEALSHGAWDYVSKPFRADEIRICVERIQERDRLVAENRQLRATVADGEGPFLGRSDAARGVLALVRQAAAFPSTVLFTGESGTGKELLARALHDLSPRAARPFVPINCAAIPENLLESELFGHARGAFTGAVRAHAGLFEQADGGTLLLDEIGDMPLALQTRLLRVLEDGRVRRVGGSSDVSVDVRVVAATATDLEAAVAAGGFREDLYYRLNVVRVRIPPLRDRADDIPLLVDALVERAADRLGRAVRGATPAALEALARHPWPGNVRQLENALERAVIVAAGDSVDLADLPVDVGGAPHGGPGSPSVLALGDDDGEASLSIKTHTASLERHLIVLALERTGGNRTQAARLLEISTKARLYKIRDYGVDA